MSEFVRLDDVPDVPCSCVDPGPGHDCPRARLDDFCDEPNMEIE